MPMRTLDTAGMADLVGQLRQRKGPSRDIDNRIHDALSTQAMHAYWLASRCLPLLGASISTRASFSAGFLSAWSETFHNLSRWEYSNVQLKLPKRNHVLIVGWHFPELPLLFRFAQATNIFVLVSQDAPWLESLKSAGCTANVGTADGRHKLVEEMAKGRVIGATLDHILPDMSAIYAPLFGRPARTPLGIFELCLANRYMIVFVAPREGGIQIVHSLESDGHSVARLAAMVNAWLEAEVKRTPERWLMWPSVTARFQGTT
jgi:lauroyl/myristoyl acyltransferase